MQQSTLVHRIQELGSFVLGTAVSSVLSYGLGLGDWLRAIQPLFMALAIVLLGVWFYLARIKRVTCKR